MSIILNMEYAFKVFKEVLGAYKYDLSKLKVIPLHYANWFIYSDEGLWFLKHSKEFFHMKGESESIDKAIFAKISKDPALKYMTIIFAQEKIFYRIAYEKWLNRRFEYVGGDGVPRWLIPKNELDIWHVMT
jgi:hypothetical protein